jgi:hypothetical protein
MNLISGVFADRARWRGCIATQTVNASVTKAILVGVNFFIANESPTENALSVADLFDEIAVTGYFGDVQASRPIADVSTSNPAVVTSNAHGYVNGQRLKVFVNTGMTQLNNRFVTVANASRNTFELSSVDSTFFTPFVRDNRNYMHPAPLFELMDESISRFVANPAGYPTKYAFFNKVMAESWLIGSSHGVSTRVSVASLRDTFWPEQKAIADAHGLQLRQYEGGLHFVGDGYLNGYGGNEQFTDYLLNSGYTRETAAVYAAMYEAFFLVGGQYPSKFVEGGRPSPYGTWGGMRYIPGDEDNPVWAEVRKVNNG